MIVSLNGDIHLEILSYLDIWDAVSLLLVGYTCPVEHTLMLGRSPPAQPIMKPLSGVSFWLHSHRSVPLRVHR